ncbi:MULTISPECIES: tripartite tricarboxylate transporter substrate-binding protein [unclassified Variovorax]|uniref:Bug family tripartite tricarboxylate transporter substrate binding protein n=1 Tax=unclassified Variovorax TaxID=663243 RepID=UPI0025786E26|nr:MULTISPECIES: tripartite tricarboxylate transporter substrate-binding protein [unclassified Variovorax]MDM0086420.1 tripartite tricarboxylate transporter substrate-binding protein [Variovorax sp. J22G40]MDM0145323.1 tripartite tricarboxylate transporter substrate-binding protein [Variovorax sp. J2P1-31]
MTSRILRRTWLAAAAATLLGPAIAWSAPPYPARPVTIVVPFPAGGGTDVIFRSVQVRLQAELGVPVIIDNRAGAGGTVGTGYGAKAPADGYTLVAATTTTIASAQAVYPKLPYDPLADLTPVGTIGSTPFVLVVTPALPVRTLAEFIAHAKKHPGALNYGSIGNGTSSHLAAELFKQRTGIEMTHIPYRGAAPAQSDLMGGQIQVLFDNPTALVPQVRAGRMRALAISEPSAVFQDLPTFEAGGVKDFQPALWYGLMAPAATPAELVLRVRTALDRALQDRALRADMLAKGVAPLTLSPAQFAAQIKTDIALWGGIARSVNAKAD